MRDVEPHYLLNTRASFPKVRIKGGCAKTDTVMQYVDSVRPEADIYPQSLVS
jgi:hypothetical protein